MFQSMLPDGLDQLPPREILFTVIIALVIQRGVQGSNNSTSLHSSMQVARVSGYIGNQSCQMVSANAYSSYICD